MFLIKKKKKKKKEILTCFTLIPPCQLIYYMFFKLPAVYATRGSSLDWIYLCLCNFCWSGMICCLLCILAYLFIPWQVSWPSLLLSNAFHYLAILDTTSACFKYCARVLRSNSPSSQSNCSTSLLMESIWRATSLESENTIKLWRARFINSMKQQALSKFWAMQSP